MDDNTKEIDLLKMIALHKADKLFSEIKSNINQQESWGQVSIQIRMMSILRGNYIALCNPVDSAISVTKDEKEKEQIYATIEKSLINWSDNMTRYYQHIDYIKTPNIDPTM